MEESRKPWGMIFIIIALIIVVGGGLYLYFGSRQKFVSPIPAEPSFKVIYYTPTPGPVTPSSTPSATPKVKPAPTKVPLPTVTPTPADTATPTPTQ